MNALDRFRLVVAVVVIAVWVAAVVTSPSHDPPAGVQLVMTGVAGWLFAGPVVSSITRRTRNGKNGGNGAHDG